MQGNLRKKLPLAFMLPVPCFAAHPLITDDTSTQGASGMQLELNADHFRIEGAAATSRNRVAPAKEKSQSTTHTTVSNVTYSYGWNDKLDLAVNLPYQSIDQPDSGKERGVGDAAFEAKWRFYENNGFSLGFKPHILLPTGNEKRGIGNGRASFGADILATYEAGAVTVLSNAGYAYNNNSIGARKDIWNVSAAMLLKIQRNMRLALDIGTYSNPDPSNDLNPAFVIGGLIYSPSEKLDLDIGWRKGLNSAEIDYVAGAGITLRW